jgi:hypothetical protein
MMRPGFGGRSSALDDPWDEVWADYDAARRQGPSRVAAPTHARPRSGHGIMILLTILALLLAASAFAASSRQAARDIAAALRAVDRASLAALVDWRALQKDASPHMVPDGGFLASLSRSVEQHRATPDGLAALVHARVGPGWPDPAIEATGLATARLVLASTSQPGRGIALSLALQEVLPPRWRVVAVEPFG